MSCDALVLFTAQENMYGAPKQVYMGDSPGDVSEEPVAQEKRKKGLRINCDVSEAMEGFENEL